MKKNYIWKYEQIDEKISILGGQDCNAIIFENNNAFTVLINGYPLAGGSALTLSGHIGEIDKTNYNFTWNANVGVIGVWRKFYVA
jgi:hypothetical protein